MYVLNYVPHASMTTNLLLKDVHNFIKKQVNYHVIIRYLYVIVSVTPGV